MENAIQDANLELLIGLRQHLDNADQLRTLFDRLLAAATAAAPEKKSQAIPGAGERTGVRRA